MFEKSDKFVRIEAYHDQLLLVEGQGDGRGEVKGDHQEELGQLRPELPRGQVFGQVLLGLVELLLGRMPKLLATLLARQRLHRRVDPAAAVTPDVVQR